MATPLQLMEKWVPGITATGSRTGNVIAVESVAILIQNGTIPEDGETRAFMNWHSTQWSDYFRDDADPAESKRSCE